MAARGLFVVSTAFFLGLVSAGAFAQTEVAPGDIETVMPVTPTMCPAIPTACPPTETRCPIRPTQCSATGKCDEAPPQRLAMLSKDEVMKTRCPRASTQCPPVGTKCPAQDSACPRSATHCPDTKTQCPKQDTQCPAVDTKCPSTDTKCPTADTQCPAQKTKCPATETNCPTADTKCPALDTKCPAVDTQCPASQTKCPATGTKCPATETKCPVQAGKCGPEMSVDFLVKGTDGKPVSGATLIAWQPCVRSVGMATDGAGTATAPGLMTGTALRAFALSPDRKFAAEVPVGIIGENTAKPVVVVLKPARTGKVYLEDAAGVRRTGNVTVYMMQPRPGTTTRTYQEEKDCHLILKAGTAGDDKAAKIDGLLPGMKCVVRATVDGCVSARIDPWTEWTIAPTDANPQLTLKFVQQK